MIISRSHPTWWGSCQKEYVSRLSKIKTWNDHLVICVLLAVLQTEHKKNQIVKKPQNKTKNINPETSPILLINMAEIKSEEEACLLYIIFAPGRGQITKYPIAGRLPVYLIVNKICKNPYKTTQNRYRDSNISNLKLRELLIKLKIVFRIGLLFIYKICE